MHLQVSFSVFSPFSCVLIFFQNFGAVCGMTEFGEGKKEFGAPMQAEADTELIKSASPVMAVGRILLSTAKFC